MAGTDSEPSCWFRAISRKNQAVSWDGSSTSLEWCRCAGASSRYRIGGAVAHAPESQRCQLQLLPGFVLPRRQCCQACAQFVRVLVQLQTRPDNTARRNLRVPATTMVAYEFPEARFSWRARRWFTRSLRGFGQPCQRHASVSLVQHRL